MTNNIVLDVDAIKQKNLPITHENITGSLHPGGLEDDRISALTSEMCGQAIAAHEAFEITDAKIRLSTTPTPPITPHGELTLREQRGQGILPG